MPYYQKNLTVEEDDLDDLQHVNNVRYLQWIQDISKEHWDFLVDPAIHEQMVWVVMKHEIEYKSAAVLGDELLITTHIGESRGALSNRIVEITDANTKTVIVKANTKWCLLNSTSLKPIRIPKEIIKIFKID